MTRGQLVLALAVLSLLPIHAAGGNHRMILLTDLLAEQDDSQMMVRLLMYANEMDIEGLILRRSPRITRLCFPRLTQAA